MEKKLVLSLDFDGTIVTAEHPRIGKVRNGAKEVITKWYNEGHTIIINSCRNGNMQKEKLDNPRIGLFSEDLY